MIAVTSHRPFRECSPPILRNQLRAAESWCDAFESAYSFGPSERSLTPFFEFIPSAPFPHIVDMAAFCSRQQSWCAILNADIVVSHSLRAVERKLIKANATCAVSKRHEFTGDDWQSGRVTDAGLDFFCAHPMVWQRVARSYPRWPRIGNNYWDSCLLSALCCHFVQGFYDLTKERIVFHPRHEDRQRVPLDIDLTGPYFSGVCWPVLTI